MTKLLAISRNTFVQTIRQPIYGVLILITFAVLVLDVPLSGWTMGIEYQATDQRMLETLGLSTLLISGLLVAAFSASSVLSREIEDKTALTVISKPVSRGTFVLGKFAGVAAAVTLAFYLCSLALLITVRHRVMSSAANPYDVPVIVLGLSALVLSIAIAAGGNYLFGWPFVSSGVWAAAVFFSVAMGLLTFIGKQWQIVPAGYDTPTTVAISGKLLTGVALMYMAVLVFVAVAIAASTRLGQVMTLLVCFGVFLVGSMHPYLFGYWADKIVLARVVGWMAPKLTFFYGLDAVAMDKAIPGEYVLLAGLYCLLYLGAIVALGAALFQRRAIEAEGSSSSMPGAVYVLAWAGRLAALVLAALAAEGTLAALVRGLGALWGDTPLTPASLEPIAPWSLAVLWMAAIPAWLLWGFYGRGVRWAWWVIVLLSGVATLLGGGVAVAGTVVVGHVVSGATAMAAGLAGAAAMLISLLPRTRRHFADEGVKAKQLAGTPA